MVMSPPRKGLPKPFFFNLVNWAHHSRDRMTVPNKTSLLKVMGGEKGVKNRRVLGSWWSLVIGRSEEHERDKHADIVVHVLPCMRRTYAIACVTQSTLSPREKAGTMTKMANKMPRHKAAGAVAVALCCTDVFLRGWQKATPRHPWLQGHERLPEILQWLDKASPGDVRYESEEMWLSSKNETEIAS